MYYCISHLFLGCGSGKHDTQYARAKRTSCKMYIIFPDGCIHKDSVGNPRKSYYMSPLDLTLCLKESLCHDLDLTLCLETSLCRDLDLTLGLEGLLCCDLHLTVCLESSLSLARVLDMTLCQHYYAMTHNVWTWWCALKHHCAQVWTHFCVLT